jgi:glycosyltransferase involved in cell wall biosynthesis
LNILLVAERFAPSVGGVETVTRLLAEAFSKAGHPAIVVTRESGTFQGDVSVLRRPGILSLLRLYQRADIVIVQGMALSLGWPLLLGHRCALMVHHVPSWLARRDFTQRREDAKADKTRMKSQTERALVRRLRVALGSRVRHATVSRAMARQLPWPIEAVLPNPYDAAVFRPDTRGCTREVVFVGRLIREKGAHVLIEALGILHRAGRAVNATIIGSGPERSRLEELARERSVHSRIHFTGGLTGSSLSQRLNEHRIQVIPSIDEPFGIVALEGAACGCAVIASNVGGLPEAVGPCGCLFAVGDAGSLAAKLIGALDCKSTDESVRLRRQEHLEKHTPDSVVQVYLKCFQEMFRTEKACSVI